MTPEDCTSRRKRLPTIVPGRQTRMLHIRPHGLRPSCASPKCLPECSKGHTVPDTRPKSNILITFLGVMRTARHIAVQASDNTVPSKSAMIRLPIILTEILERLPLNHIVGRLSTGSIRLDPGAWQSRFRLPPGTMAGVLLGP